MIQTDLLRLKRYLRSWTILISVIRVEFVSHLSATLASAKLSPMLEARIPVYSDLPPINELKVKAINCLLGLISCRKLNEAETTRSLLPLVQAHYEVDNLTEALEELKKLSLMSVERQVANV